MSLQSEPSVVQVASHWSSPRCVSFAMSSRSHETKRPGGVSLPGLLVRDVLFGLGHGDERDATASAGSPPGLGTTTTGRLPHRHEVVVARLARWCQAFSQVSAFAS